MEHSAPLPKSDIDCYSDKGIGGHTTMKEPVDVNRLIVSKKSREEQQSKPRFISSSSRGQLKPVVQQSPPTVKLHKPQRVESALAEKSQTLKPKPQKRKFNFEWDDEEDTTTDEPLLLIRPKKQRDTFSVHRKHDSYGGLHWSEKPLDKMTKRDWRIIKEDFNISAKGESAGEPLRNWHESEIDSSLVSTIKKLGYIEPTPIQRATIPTALKYHDLVGLAETGSGKTLAYIVPILDYILKMPSFAEEEKGPFVLVLVPTRELAVQIMQEFSKFTHNFPQISCVSLIGGHSVNDSITQLGKQGSSIVVATPGRLLDVIERQIIHLNSCFYLVMDEADRMIDMGFEDQVNSILERLPRGKRNPYLANHEKIISMMFTATMPASIKSLMTNYLHQPAIFSVGEVGNPADKVEQHVEFIPTFNGRLHRVSEILHSHRYHPPIILFCNYKKVCDTVSQELSQDGISNVTLHGSKSQEQRELSLQKIKNGEASILIATDVAGRGIDIPDVSLVINFQMSRNIQDYTHRVGRTGRAGKSGHAITFLHTSHTKSEDEQFIDLDNEVVFDLKKLLMKSTNSKCPVELKNNEFAQRDKL